MYEYNGATLLNTDEKTLEIQFRSKNVSQKTTNKILDGIRFIKQSKPVPYPPLEDKTYTGKLYFIIQNKNFFNFIININ